MRTLFTPECICVRQQSVNLAVVAEKAARSAGVQFSLGCFYTEKLKSEHMNSQWWIQGTIQRCGRLLKFLKWLSFFFAHASENFPNFIFYTRGIKKFSKFMTFFALTSMSKTQWKVQLFHICVQYYGRGARVFPDYLIISMW